MAEKFSPDVLLQTATQLYLSVRKNKGDFVREHGSIEDRRTKEMESFVIFYSQLRDKLTKVAE